MPTKSARGRRTASRLAALTRSPPAAPRVRTAWAVATELRAGEVWVEVAGRRARARTVVELEPAAVRAAIVARTPVLVTWTDDEPESPIILGLVQSVGPAVGQKLERRPDVARVDGKRVTLSAEDEIELRCGEASITLRRNGRLVIRGAYVETTSRGTNRIRGGSVQVN